MSNYLLSAQSLVSEMTEHIYPTIDQNLGSVGGMTLPTLYEIKLEYNSLKTYEEKLIFPEVLKILGSKTEYKSGLNINELILLMQKKESLILEYLKELSMECQGLELENDIQVLIHYFYDSYFPTKKKWYNMMDHLKETDVPKN